MKRSAYLMSKVVVAAALAAARWRRQRRHGPFRLWYSISSTSQSQRSVRVAQSAPERPLRAGLPALSPSSVTRRWKSTAGLRQGRPTSG